MSRMAWICLPGSPDPMAEGAQSPGSLLQYTALSILPGRIGRPPGEDWPEAAAEGGGRGGRVMGPGPAPGCKCCGIE